MRVLQVIETGGPGGAETVFARLSSGLRDGGHDVQCVVADGDWLPAELRRRGLPVVVTPRSSRSLDLELLRLLRAEMRRSQAQLVHAHLFEGALYAAIAARLEGIPCVATLHGQVDVGRGGLKGRVKSWLFRRLVSRVVAVSEALRRDLQAGLQLPERVFRVIPNGVPVVDEDVLVRDKSADRPRRVIAIGNIRRPKDYPTLLDAMAKVRDAVPSVQLEILGQPDREGLYEALQAQVERLGLGNVVTFRGFVADPSVLLRAADVFVLSSSQEGFSLATIEAMLAGVPVVATRSGGPQEILEDDVTGLLVPVRDPEALAAALVRVLRDAPPFAERMAQAARERARVTYSESGMVSAYVTLYDELVARGAS